MQVLSKNPSVSVNVYRAGLVGCGRIGCGFDDQPREARINTHAGAYVDAGGVNLAALADVDGEKVRRYGDKYGVEGRYTDYREMLASERLDILSICTWNDTHREIVEHAVEAGVRAIFCEKPIADSLAAADAMVDLCRERGILLMIDHKRRFDRFHREVASFLRDGGLGTIHQATSYYSAGVANTGSHLLDLLRCFFGDAAWVRGWPSRIDSPNPQDPNIDGWVEFETGPRVALQTCDVRDYVIFEINVLGSAGRLRIMASGHDLQYEMVGDSNRFAGHRELIPATPPVDPSGGREFMLQAAEHLVECLDAGRNPVSSGEDGRAALELICALRLSAESDGQRIELPLTERSLTIQSK